MATILELAKFSQAAYWGGNPDPLIWNKLEACQENSNDYYGQAYQSIITNEIVIANRGTRVSSVNDLLNDIKLAALVSTSSQESAAAYALLIARNYPGVPIIETGHSLTGR